MIRRLQALARHLLPAAIRRPLADRVYGLLTRAMNLRQNVRLRLLALRLRAASHPGLGRVVKSAQRWVHELTPRLVINYAGRLENFGQALPTPARLGQGHKGVAMMIGTLGGGGSERQLVLTAQGLQARGMTGLAVTVASLQDEADRFFLPDLTQAGVRAVAFDDLDHTQELPAHAASALGKLPRKITSMRAHLRVLAQHRPEVAHLWLDEVNVKGGLAAVALGVPRIVLGMRSVPPTNFLLYQPYMRDCYRWLARQPGVVMINNSQAGAEAYEQWLELPQGSITILRNGFVFEESRLRASREQRPHLRERLGIPPGAPVVGSAMRLSEEKRPGLWLESAAHLTALLPEAHFIVAGDGPMFKAVQRKTKKLGLGGRLHWLGRTKEVFAAMAAMDLFLLTSRVEGLPNVLVEAQSLGVPVVSTKAGGAPETMRHGVTGWVLERDDPRYIAQELKRLWDDQDWRRRAQTEGLPWVQRRFGLERMIDETLAVYQLDRRQIGGAATQEVRFDSRRGGIL
ncbi:MAG: glycosyltransferase [Desulfarculus sp.]|nr:glycosyltransferase [Pseudomonadota bacterium]MBV1717653.1 glycosyltransferase [Desulfarculus sp.]MBU4573896.1 glycosyltransferase [Pseudomonadota bacterium]MBU4599194.1 glycosyltransferase [Pseudomonadota bacterium]MBV1739753.1 glycosyltransferase [Desulfarculus sp.]